LLKEEEMPFVLFFEAGDVAGVFDATAEITAAIGVNDG